MKKLKLEIYQAKDKGYRWRARSRNGRIVCDSGESYKRKLSARKSMWNFILDLKAGDFEEVEK